MADIIKLLPDSVANQIAAGEVIQRPASVVKELTENGVDAGSTVINVVVKDAGKTLIQVTDNGSGMSVSDAKLAFERHATSKITSANDLFAINTKGFRGEALASIAAVAMVEMKTRKEGTDTGTSIKISGSRIESQDPCSSGLGTCLSVKNLFYNIPARRKFLKADTTEFRHIVNEFQKISLAHPEIKFTLEHNGTEIYNLVPGNHRQRIVGLFGKQINQELISIETETNLIGIKGFIGKPESARRTYGEQFFFVNNRFMKHPYFHKAVTEAYQNILPADVVPSYFIYLTTDPASIDINIHPTKTEIKFEDERAIWQILMAAVRESLGRFNIVPSIDFEGEGMVNIPISGKSDFLPETPHIAIDPTYDPFAKKNTYTRDSYIDRFEKENNSNWKKLFPERRNESSAETEIKTTIAEPERKFMQIKNRYISCPVKSGLLLIDQKRGHERVLYENFMESLNSNRSASQTTLFPVTVELSQDDFLVLKEIENDLKTIGFDIEYGDDSVIIINGYPSITGSTNIKETIEILVEEFKSTSNDPSTGVKEKLAAAMASAGAIPYGKPLSNREMETLFDSLFGCSSPNYTPKGKAIVSIVTIDELDKRFQ
jgi:DNA mismatch repair protein MutL